MKFNLNFRLLLEQKKLQFDIDHKQTKLAEVQIQKLDGVNFLCDFENEVKPIKVNLSSVDENIKELEGNISQVQDSKVFLFLRFIFKCFNL